MENKKKKTTVRYMDKADDISLFKLSENKEEFRCMNRISIRYKTIYIPKGVLVINTKSFSELYVKEIILPDGLKRINKAAFKDCKQLKKIYIPKSVEIIEDEAFLGCNKVEIYCEDEPKEGWLSGTKEEIEHWENNTDAFNFHRSGGSFDDLHLEKWIETIYNHYNPDNRPIHNHVSREQFEKLLEE